MNALNVLRSGSGVRSRGRAERRTDNYFAVGRFERRMEMLTTNLPAGSIPLHHGEAAYGMLVADGLGGLAAGEIASRTAVTTLIDLVIGTPDWILRLDDVFRRSVERRMELRLQWVDRLLNERARQTPGVRSMATALTVAASSGRDLVIAHVGSSRAYHWHEASFYRLTRDHTRVESLVETGAIDAEDVAFHPERHIVTRALGWRTVRW